MMTKISGILTALLTATVCAFSASAQTNAEPAQTNAATPTTPANKFVQLFGDDVVAKGKGVEVKRSQLDTAMTSIRSSAAARGQNIPPEFEKTVERQVLERLIQVQLLLNKATEADKAKGKEMADKRVSDMIERAGSQENFDRQLNSVGLTAAELRSKVTEEATAEAVVERELNVTVTDDEVKQYYDEHPAKFEQPEMVRAAHILLSTRDPKTNQPLSDEQKAAKHKEMEGILKRARAGEDFAKLAEEYSDDPGSKNNGGEYTFPRGRMVPEFEAAAFSLKTNQISDIVTTQFGYHIIKLLEKIPAKKIEFDKVADNIKEGLTQQKMVKELPDYVAKLKKAADVQILDKDLQKVDDAAVTGGSADEPAGADTSTQDADKQ